MKFKMKIILIGILIALLSSSCKKQNVEEPPVVEESEDVVKEDEVVEEVPKKEGIPSPISGIYAEEVKVNRRPVAVMFDNHHSARWQSGLKDAEIVYEFLVEAPYTRYMGIYLINDPPSIGPIRSARPYFITSSLEYDAVYVHVGGSEQAKSDIRTLKIADIDGLSSSNKVFFRKSHKKAPHNTYSSMEVIRATQEERKYKLTGEYTPFKFREDEADIEGNIANKLTIKYMKNNTTQYNYDEEKKVYTREKDGKLHIDEIDETPIVAKNIIIQEAKTKVLDKEGRLEIQLVGEGEGKYITNGKVMDIKWVKKSRNDKTLYYNPAGEEIVLNPGVTWIQVINAKTEIIIE
ncbi:DUF3048 domain-containing protein [Tissierella carlieri]|jgi:hypothetical protein|uniref:DUF3048 domain-containing protein n=2 Tax=Tissierella carlieri TaxID=689904 RepID=UPI001C109150|nr:DUF3048 domain-containing protein [Tissierella carlieri]MBU5313594.1 DUF3048 domain-containing protein [Tissierella carlieri]MDU5080560.1 DUF3048 domain-containing protein [Bacillota bacterium]